jgi:hypothetical protein
MEYSMLSYDGSDDSDMSLDSTDYSMLGGNVDQTGYSVDDLTLAGLEPDSSGSSSDFMLNESDYSMLNASTPTLDGGQTADPANSSNTSFWGSVISTSGNILSSLLTSGKTIKDISSAAAQGAMGTSTPAGTTPAGTPANSGSTKTTGGTNAPIVTYVILGVVILVLGFFLFREVR